MFEKKDLRDSAPRILSRHLARELTTEELELVSGAGGTCTVNSDGDLDQK
jgi:hypothetical protein